MSKNPEELEKEIAQERAEADNNLEELEERLSPGQLIDDVLSAVGDGPKKFITELAAQVRDNPVPTAVTAAGMAWLAAASQSSKSHQRAADGPRFTAEDRTALNRYNRIRALESETRRFANETDEEFNRRMLHAHAGALEVEHEDGETFEAFKERVDSAASRTKEAASSLLHKIEAAGSRVGGALSSAGHGIAGAAGSAADTAQGAAASAKHGLEHGASTVSHSASDAAAWAKHFERENPLIAGALAFAGGALLGSLVPNTRVENEAMGQKAEALRGEAKTRAGAAAHEALDEARDTVRSAENGSPAHH